VKTFVVTHWKKIAPAALVAGAAPMIAAAKAWLGY
jgi:hypothetical protein